MSSTIFFAVFFTVVGIAGAERARRSEGSRAALALARAVDLPLEPSVEPVVRRRLGRREVAGAVGGLLLVWAAAVWWEVGPPRWDAPDAVSLGPMVVALAFFVGHATGLAAVAWAESVRPVGPAGPRVARLSAPVVADYVARHERWGAWALAALAPLLAVLTRVVEVTGAADVGAPPWSVLVVAAVLPAVVTGLGELAARRLVAGPQPAGHPLELAWDDALRARTLRDLVTAGLVVGAVATFAVLGLVSSSAPGGWPENPVVGVVSGLALVLLLAAVVMAVVSWTLRPQRHVRTRLWPDGPHGPEGSTGPDGPDGPDGPEDRATPPARSGTPGHRPGAVGR